MKSGGTGLKVQNIHLWSGWIWMCWQLYMSAFSLFDFVPNYISCINYKSKKKNLHQRCAVVLLLEMDHSELKSLSGHIMSKQITSCPGSLKVRKKREWQTESLLWRLLLFASSWLTPVKCVRSANRGLLSPRRAPPLIQQLLHIRLHN